MKSLPPEAAYGLGADTWLATLLRRPTYRVQDPLALPAAADLRAFFSGQEEGVAFVHGKADVKDLPTIRSFERAGFSLIDTNVVFEMQSPKTPLPTSRVHLRHANREDREAVLRIAEIAFVWDRWHADERIGAALGNRINQEWVGNFFAGGRGDALLVAEADTAAGPTLVGFSLLIFHKDVQVIDLIAVDPAHHRGGIGRQLLHFGAASFPLHTKLRVGTQLANLPALRLYEDFGFRLAAAQHVYHLHT